MNGFFQASYYSLLIQKRQMWNFPSCPYRLSRSLAVIASTVILHHRLKCVPSSFIIFIQLLLETNIGETKILTFISLNSLSSREVWFLVICISMYLIVTKIGRKLSLKMCLTFFNVNIMLGDGDCMKTFNCWQKPILNHECTVQKYLSVVFTYHIITMKQLHIVNNIITK